MCRSVIWRGDWQFALLKPVLQFLAE